MGEMIAGNTYSFSGNNGFEKAFHVAFTTQELKEMSITPDKLEEALTAHLANLHKSVHKDAKENEAARKELSTIKWSLSSSPKANEKMFSEVFGLKPKKPFEDFPVPIFKEEDWNEEIRPFIPKVDEGFVFENRLLCQMVLGYLSGDNVFLHGPKGSGKSTNPEQLCARLGIPFVRMGMKEDMESSELFGSNTLRGKEVIWVDGPVTVAAQYGAVVCLDEASNITPGAAIALHPLLEENRRLLLSDKIGSIGDRTVKIDPRFRVFLTDNTNLQGDVTGKYVGTKVQNEAYKDRIFTTLYVGYMDEAKEIALILNRVPECPEGLAKAFVRFGDLVRKNYTQGTVQTTVSPRVLINWARKATAWGSIDEAYRAAFGAGLSDDDAKICGEHFKKVFGE